MKFDEFLTSLKSMEYLDPSIVIYPSEFASLLRDELIHGNGISDSDSSGDISEELDKYTGFAALTVLLQYSYTRQNVCIPLERSRLLEIVSRMGEQFISNNYKSKFFMKSDNPDELKKEELERFNSIWKMVLPEDDAACCFDRIPESFLLRISSDSGKRDLIQDAPFVLYDNSHLYYARLYNEETFIADYISRNGRPGTGLILEKGLSRDESSGKTERIRDYLNILFGNDGSEEPDLQKCAVAVSCLSNFSVITGGPGTGKTTTVVKLLLLMECLFADSSENLMISLAAPTGKAANRMKESIRRSLDGFRAEKNGILEKLSVRLGEEGITKTAGELYSIVPAEASTIHKLIGISPSGHCRYNHDNPLSCNVIIVDEASMLDIENFYNLLRALKDGCKVILLGDQNQLPSVEAGSIFGDLCRAFLGENRKISDALKNNFLPDNFSDSENISDNAVRLVKSHRFDGSKGIGKLAAWVNSGGSKTKQNLEGIESLLESFNPADQKSKIWNSEDAEGKTYGIKLADFSGKVDAVSRLKDFLGRIRGYDKLWEESAGIEADLSLRENELKAGELFRYFDNFRVLCTNRETVFGVISVNQIYEEIFFRKGGKNARWRHGGSASWYPGLPVMITRNNYALNLFNGDIGITLKDPYSSDDSELRVLFRMSDGSYRYYPTSVLSDFEPAYAMTIHKSQGSEADHVLILSQEKDSSFITREILYTGITRARKTVTMIYDPENFTRQCARQIMRCSNLEQRLLKNLGGEAGE